MPFSPDYVRLVLNENFEDAKALFLEPLMAIHYAHLAMLAEQGIVTPRRRARDPAGARRHRSRDAFESVGYDGSCEDLFFYVERLLVASRAGRTWPAGCTPRAAATTST